MPCAFALEIQMEESPEAGTALGKEGRGRGWWSVAEEARPAGGCTLGLEAVGLDWSQTVELA